jgi:hypothetical protein
MPVIEEFATYIMSDVIPNLEEWITLNETKLRDSFKGTLDTLFALSINIVKIIGFLEKYKEILLVIASIPLISVFGSQIAIIVGLGKMVADGLKAIPKATGSVTKAFKGFDEGQHYVANQMNKKIGKGGMRGGSARHAIVKEVMAKHGLSLPEASKFVMVNGLY